MLFVYRSNRLERLADALADVLQDPPPTPTAQEWICVQTQGMGIWLGMTLSERFGVWANAYHPFPRVVIDALFTSVLGEASVIIDSAEANALTWAIMALLPGHLVDRSEFSSLKRYLADDEHGVKQYQLSSRIGRAFDQYAVYRPDMVLAWETDETASSSLAPEQRWQPILWRAVWEQLGGVHTANIFRDYLTQMNKGEVPLPGLPSRLTFFGISTLPPLYLQTLEALPPSLPVHLFVLSPSREFWADVRSRKEIDRDAAKQLTMGAPVDDDTYWEEGHPLLATLGRLAREFQSVLEENTGYMEPRDDLYEDPVGEGAGTMLALLQSDILNLRLRRNGSTPPALISDRDRSIEIHACHSAMREIQILKDQILGMLDEDASLHPHNIIVMAPNIETYAPFIESVFGSDAHTPHGVPYTVSDRQLLQDAAVVRAFMALVRLIRSRLSIQEVVDFLSLAPVRERFDLTEAEVGVGIEWFREAGIRWGLDDGHRTDAGQPDFLENTWRFGLDRLLLGVAMPGEQFQMFGDVLPYTDIEGQAAESLGQLAAFCERLFDVWRRCQSTKTAAAWRDTLLDALSSLLACRPENENQHQLIREACQSLVSVSTHAGFEEPLHLDVVERWLADWIDQRTGTSGFLSGGVTFCNLLPMRSIPFNIVYLIGMNDLDFPRHRPSVGFDLTERAPRAGDRSVRNDDRYLFLEALLSARSRFIISYVGYDIKDNSPKPPSVVVDELIDVLCDGFSLALPSSGRVLSPEAFKAHLITRHYLHPFHEKYFLPGEQRHFSYSSTYFAGAVAGTGERKLPPSFFPMPSLDGPPAQQVVRLQDLLRFFRMPARFFLKHRLGVSLQEGAEALSVREPMMPDALDRYDIGEMILRDLLVGEPPENTFRVLRAAGKLPLGKAGHAFYDKMIDAVGPIAQEMFQHMGTDQLSPLSIDCNISGIQIQGVLGNRWPRMRLLATVGRLSPYRLLSVWIEHLVLCRSVAQEDVGTSVLVGRGKHRVEVVSFPPVLEQGEEWLTALVSFFLRGQSVPLRFFPNTSHAFATAWHRTTGEDPSTAALKAARNAWRGYGGRIAGDGVDLSVHRIFGDSDPLTDPLDDASLSFERLSLDIFSPLLTTLEQGTVTLGEGVS